MRKQMATKLRPGVAGDRGGVEAFRHWNFFFTERASSLLLVMVLSLGGLSACVTKSVLAPSASEIVVSFSLSPPQALQLGSQTTLMVNVANDVTDAGVDWVASCSAANCGSFNPIHTLSGVATVYTAPNSIPAGNTINLTAKSTASPSESVTVTIAIQSSISVTLTGFPASPLAAGSTTQVTAKVTGDPNNLGVDWSLLCGAGNCGSITLQTASNVAATYTAPPSVTTSLNVTITATSVFDPTQTVTTNVTVTSSGTVSIAFGLNPPPPTAMNTGATASIVSIVSGDNTNAGVNWSVSCSNSSNSCGTFNPSSPAHTASGTAVLYTAPTTVPASGLSVSVMATAAASPNPFVTVIITVTTPVPTIGPINGAPSSLPVNGKSNPLSATVTNDSTSNGGVDWSLSCTPAVSGEINPCGIFSSGLATDHTASGGTTTYTAPSTIPGGSPPNVTITAASTANPSSASTAIITITTTTAVTIKFATAPPSTLITNATANVSATVTNDPNNPPLGVDWAIACSGGTGTNPCGTLSVSHTPSGGTVIYTAPTTVPSGGSGGVTITATATAAPNPSVSGTVTILPPNVIITVAANSPLDSGSAEQVSAVVSGDTTNAGVSWSASCTQTAGAGCGTFNPLSSPGTNNPTTSYTAPASVPNGGTVTITATSLAAGVSAVGTAQVTVQPNANLGFLSGSYALSLSGQNSAGFFAIVGSVTADGKGGITNGEEYINAALNVCSPSAATSPVEGTYSVGADGRGSMTLQTGNANCFGNGGVQTLSFVVVGGPGQGATAVRALVTEFDNTSASGSLDLQTPGATINGSYAFTMSGIDIAATNASGAVTADVGGVFAASGGAITSGFLDENDQGTSTVLKKQSLGNAGSYAAPDAEGCGFMLLGPTSPANSVFTYFYCVVNAGQIKLLSWDVNDFLAVAGTAYAQGTGTFSAQNAFTVSGLDGVLDTPVVAGGIFGVSGTSLAGDSVIDVNDGGDLTLDSSVSGSTFSAVSSGRGTLTLTGVTGGLSSFAFYPTANNGVLLFDLDTNFASIGAAYPQTVGDLSTTFNGTYAVNLTGAISGSPEEDMDGLVISDNTGVLSGTVDVNGAPVESDLGGIVLAGAYTTNSTAGRFPGSLNLDLTASDTQKFTEIFYVLNANTVLFIEDDTSASAIAGQTSGILQLQNLGTP
jgi:hypothetical protein